ncbi:MAG: MBL fold metallo-hydrolase [Desulfurococcaceae archaeon]
MAEATVVGETKAVLLGTSVAVDGHWHRRVRAITHAHSDHMLGLEESLRSSDVVVATGATVDMAEELLGDAALRALLRRKARPLPYRVPLDVGGARIELLEADHIVGSAQVVVEEGGLRLAYTGDFRLTPATRVVDEPDVLVIDATYGDPRFRRPFKHEVPEALASLVEDGLARYDRVVVYGYHGKLQAAMELLRRHGVEGPFVAPPKIYRLSVIAMRHGLSIGSIREGSWGDGCVIFKHASEARRRKFNDGSLHVLLSGWEFEAPARRVGEDAWVVALSGHADFDELVEYVALSKPSRVVIDGTRSSVAHRFRRALESLGFRALVAP